MRTVFTEILSNASILLIDDLLDLFDHLASFLTEYEYSRHEVALLLHVDLLHRTIPAWTSPLEENRDVCEVATKAYEWFVETALEHNICPTSVTIGLSKLFVALFRICGPLYVAYDKAPSVRTTLFKLLCTTDILLLHSLVEELPSIFDHYTLDMHEEVFNDVHEKSMNKMEWLEREAMRMLMQCELGSHWNTLMRRCVYHIFEMAGIVPQLQGYATRCIARLAKSVGSTDARSLFHLFAGQLLYTWTRRNDGGWDSIPFAIFGYSSLKGLLFDVREEVYAGLMLRNEQNELAAVAATLGFGQQELATFSFARTVAYSLAIDADLKPKRPTEQHKSETRLRGIVGDKYTTHCAAHLAKALGILMLRTNFEKRQDKKKKNDQQETPNGDTHAQQMEEPLKEIPEAILEKRISALKAAKQDVEFEMAALKAFQEMRAISSSDVRLPDPQQPM